MILLVQISSKMGSFSSSDSRTRRRGKRGKRRNGGVVDKLLSGEFFELFLEGPFFFHPGKPLYLFQKEVRKI